MKILAIDPRQIQLCRLLGTPTNQTPLETTATQRWAIEQLVAQTQTDSIVIEASSITGWVHGLCQGVGYRLSLPISVQRHGGGKTTSKHQ